MENLYRMEILIPEYRYEVKLPLKIWSVVANKAVDQFHDGDFCGGVAVQYRNEWRSNPTPRRNPNETRWLGSLVKQNEIDYRTLRDLLPEFECRPLSVTQADSNITSIHPRLVTIIRKPTREDPYYQAAGVVSANYGFIDHRSILDRVESALCSNGIGVIDKANLLISEFGERMHLSIYLPDRYSYDPGDGNKMALRLEIINSVDGSSRLRIMLGWFRFVCSNGLVVGITKMDVNSRHIRRIDPDKLCESLPDALRAASEDMEVLSTWNKICVPPDILMKWVDGPLKEAWGIKAAARALLICSRGVDGEPAERYDKSINPSTLLMRATRKVPGAPDNAFSLFDVSQALAWIAKERNEVEEKIQWRSQIPALIEELM